MNWDIVMFGFFEDFVCFLENHRLEIVLRNLAAILVRPNGPYGFSEDCLRMKRHEKLLTVNALMDLTLRMQAIV